VRIEALVGNKCRIHGIISGHEGFDTQGGMTSGKPPTETVTVLTIKEVY
jgi:hypothetical protein